MLKEKRVLLGVTGSISAYKAAELARALVAEGAKVQVCLTRSASAFITPLTFEALTGRPVLFDVLEVQDGKIPHVEEAYAADLAIVAPASANALAKMASGIADEALYATLLSVRAPLIVAPAMESRMWSHPATQANVKTLADRGATMVGPASGALASGRSGEGRLAPMEEIVATARALTEPPRAPVEFPDSGGIPTQDRVAKWPTQRPKAAASLTGKHVLITAGPTIEDLDPVRFLTNRSSGKMGVALAMSATSHGARVTFVHGPLQVPVPQQVRAIEVRSAQNMHDVVHRTIADVDVAILAAAVADYRPARVADQKMKKGDDDMQLVLERTPDILKSLGALSARPILVGFAAETQNVVENAQRKLKKKGCDVICANQVGGAESAFGSDDNAVTLVFKDGRVQRLERAEKGHIADAIVEAIGPLVGGR